MPVNNRVRKVLTNGTVITIAGIGPSFFDGGTFVSTHSTFPCKHLITTTNNQEVTMVMEF